MLDKLRHVLDIKFTIAQLMIIGTIVGTPYLLIGAIWSSTHTERLHQLQGADLAVAYLGSVVAWPIVLLANVCMT